MKIIIVEKNEAGQRLDKLLLKYLNNAPKSFIYKMLRKKNIVLNGKKADGSERLVQKDEVKLFLSDETMANFSSEKQIEIVNQDFSIVFESEDVLIVNKPVGLLSQKANENDISLVEQIISYLKLNGVLTDHQLQTFRPGICNRLDRNTSGLVVAGKTLAGLQTMSELFHDRTIDKYYLCIVKGVIQEPQYLKGYLLKQEHNNQVIISKNKIDGSEFIETEYKPLKWNKEYSLLEVKLITGKTHQIRGHLQSIGHPILGDYKYGIRAINQKFKENYGLESQLLHSYRIRFPKLPLEFHSISEKEFVGEVPCMFQTIQEDLFQG